MEKRIITMTYDPIGAFYFRLNDKEGIKLKGIEVDATTAIDVDENGKVVGVEVIIHDKDAIEKINDSRIVK